MMTPQCDFSPLIERDTEAGDADTQEILEGDVAHSWWIELRRPCIWIVCSATAIITTKRLLVNHGYHYPLTIAFHSFATTLIVYLIFLRIASCWSTIPGNTQWGLRQLSWNAYLLNRYWAMMLPAALAAAVSFPMLLEGLLHMPSLPVIVMLFPLAYAAESLVLFICCSPSRSKKFLPWEAVLVTVASSIVLYNEYRLTVPGLIWGVTSVLLLGLSRACFVIGTERSGPELAVEARLKVHHGFVVMTLVFGLLFSGAGAFLFEHIHLMHPLDGPTKALMVVNIASMVGMAFSGTSVLAYTPISYEASRLQFSNIPLPTTEVAAPIASSLLVSLVSVYWHPTWVSGLQIAAYLIAATWLVGGDRIHDFVLDCMDSTLPRSGSGKGFPEPRKPSRILTSGGLVILVVLLSWILSGLSFLSISSLPPSLPTTFDLAYRPQSQFDIVVSMYQESPTSIKSMVEKIKSTTYLSTITPQIIIYTKDNTSDLDTLKLETGANIVRRLPNTGREGGTYLHHIVTNWDSLAEKTMFIQAHAHNMRELIPHINSYLVPHTGMLSLGFSGVTCNCGTCSDRFGWEDELNVIPTLYQKIYGTGCASNQQISLSYKGQFIASAKRIRGIRKKNYQGLLDAISGPSNGTVVWTGGLGVEEENESNPSFGFTVERVWGLLMQCATDGKVVARCPSLLSGMGRGGEVGDCQCLDEVR